MCVLYLSDCVIFLSACLYNIVLLQNAPKVTHFTQYSWQPKMSVLSQSDVHVEGKYPSPDYTATKMNFKTITAG